MGAVAIETYPPSTPPASNSNLWMLVAAGGIGAILLATVILFFNNFDPIPDKEKATAVFWLIGHCALVVATALMAAMMRAWPMGIRIAALSVSLVVASGLFGSPFMARYAF